MECLVVTLSLKELVEQPIEDRSSQVRQIHEQGRAGFQLHIVRGTENLVSGLPLYTKSSPQSTRATVDREQDGPGKL